VGREERDERRRELVTDWETDTQTHTDGEINEQIFWQRHTIQREKEREHQGKRQYSSSLRLSLLRSSFTVKGSTKDGLSCTAI